MWINFYSSSSQFCAVLDVSVNVPISSSIVDTLLFKLLDPRKHNKHELNNASDNFALTQLIDLVWVMSVFSVINFASLL